MRNHVVSALAAGVFLLGLGPAAAAPMPCNDFDPDVTTRVAPSIGCQIDEAFANDSDGFGAAGWFGETDWVFSAKTNADGGGIETIDELGDSGLNDFGFSVTGDTLSGEWSFDSAPGPVMLVFKGGTPMKPAPLVAYLLAGDSGTYASPFFRLVSDFPDSPTEISHISAWVREGDGVNAIPLPSSAWLMLSAFAVMGIGRWTARRRA